MTILRHLQIGITLLLYTTMKDADGTVGELVNLYVNGVIAESQDENESK